MTKNILFSILFSATLIIAMMVCLICNIAISGRFDMGDDSNQLHCFCMGYLFPCHRLRKEGIPGKPDIPEHFYYSLFIPAESFHQNRTGIYHRYGDGCNFRRFPVDHRRHFQPNREVKKVSRFRSNFPVRHWVFDSCQ